jgi:hypothetical protein
VIACGGIDTDEEVVLVGGHFGVKNLIEVVCLTSWYTSTSMKCVQ